MVFLSPLSTTKAPSTFTSTTTSAESVPSTNISTAELINQIQNGQWYSTDTGSPGAESTPGVTPNISSPAPKAIGGASIAPNTTPTTTTTQPSAPAPIQTIQNPGSVVLVDQPVIPKDAQLLSTQQGANLAYLSPSGALYYYYSPSFATKLLSNNPFANGSRYSLDENSNLVSELYQIPNVNFNKLQASASTAPTNPLELDYAAFGEALAPNVTFTSPTEFTATYNNNGVAYNILGNIPVTQSFAQQEALNAAVDASYQAVSALGKQKKGTLVDINLDTGAASITSPNSTTPTLSSVANPSVIEQISKGEYYSPYTGPRPIHLTAPSGTSTEEEQLSTHQPLSESQALDLTQSSSAPSLSTPSAAQTLSAAGPYVSGVGNSAYYMQPLLYNSSSIFNTPLASLQYSLSHSVTSGVQDLGRELSLVGSGLEKKLGLTNALQTYNNGVVKPIEQAYTYNTANPFLQFAGGLGQSFVGGLAALPEAPFALLANPLGSTYNLATSTASDFANPTPSNLGRGLGVIGLTGAGLEGGSLLSEEATGNPAEIASIQNVIGNEEPVVVRAAGAEDVLSPEEIKAMRNQGLAVTKVSRDVYPNQIAKLLGQTNTKSYYIGSPYEEFSAEQTPTITPQEAAERSIFRLKGDKFVKVGKININPTASLTSPLSPLELSSITPVTPEGQVIPDLNVAPDVTQLQAPPETPLSTSTIYEMPIFNTQPGLRELELGKPLAQSIQESHTAEMPLYREGALYHTYENEHVPLTFTKGTISNIENTNPLANFKILRFGRPVLNGVVSNSEGPLREVYAAFEAAKPNLGNPLAPIGGLPRGLLTFSSALSPNYGLSNIPSGLPTGESFTPPVPISSPNYALNSPISLAPPSNEGGRAAANGGYISANNGTQAVLYQTQTPSTQSQTQEPLSTIEENIPIQENQNKYSAGSTLLNEPLQQYSLQLLPKTPFRSGQQAVHVFKPSPLKLQRASSMLVPRVDNAFRTRFVPITPYSTSTQTEIVPVTTQTTTRKQLEQPTTTSTTTSPLPTTPSPTLPIPLLKLHGGAGGSGSSSKEISGAPYGVYSPDVDVLLFPQLNQYGINSTASPLLGLGIRPERQYLQSPNSPNNINIAYA